MHNVSCHTAREGERWNISGGCPGVSWGCSNDDTQGRWTGDHTLTLPHSCGHRHRHRHCPHCQNHENQQWLKNQLQKRVPANYFLLTFTVPAELRGLVWCHQRRLYALMLQCVWETVRSFSLNDKQLQGVPDATAVLHTHSRRLDFHPHVHLVMPAAAIDADNKLWRTKVCSAPLILKPSKTKKAIFL